YSVLLKLLYPTSLCLVLLLAGAFLRKRKIASRVCFWLAVGTLLVCGNGWLGRELARHLEWQYLPSDVAPGGADHGPRTTDYGLRTTDHGPRTTDYGL